LRTLRRGRTAAAGGRARPSRGLPSRQPSLEPMKPQDPRGKAEMDYTVAAVDRALKLLEAVAENPNIGLTELARLTGTTKTLAFRMASTLEARGYLLKDPTSRCYALGYKPLYLSERMQHESHLLGVAEPFLDDLAQRTRENVSLTVREVDHTVCIALRQ